MWRAPSFARPVARVLPKFKLLENSDRLLLIPSKMQAKDFSLQENGSNRNTLI
jgi:hypothetical protein